MQSQGSKRKTRSKKKEADIPPLGCKVILLPSPPTPTHWTVVRWFLTLSWKQAPRKEFKRMKNGRNRFSL